MTFKKNKKTNKKKHELINFCFCYSETFSMLNYYKISNSSGSHNVTKGWNGQYNAICSIRTNRERKHQYFRWQWLPFIHFTCCFVYLFIYCFLIFVLTGYRFWPWISHLWGPDMQGPHTSTLVKKARQRLYHHQFNGWGNWRSRHCCRNPSTPSQ